MRGLLALHEADHGERGEHADGGHQRGAPARPAALARRDTGRPSEPVRISTDAESRRSGRPARSPRPRARTRAAATAGSDPVAAAMARRWPRTYTGPPQLCVLALLELAQQRLADARTSADLLDGQTRGLAPGPQLLTQRSGSSITSPPPVTRPGAPRRVYVRSRLVRQPFGSVCCPSPRAARRARTSPAGSAPPPGPQVQVQQHLVEPLVARPRSSPAGVRYARSRGWRRAPIAAWLLPRQSSASTSTPAAWASSTSAAVTARATPGRAPRGRHDLAHLGVLPSTAPSRRVPVAAAHDPAAVAGEDHPHAGGEHRRRARRAPRRASGTCSQPTAPPCAATAGHQGVQRRRRAASSGSATARRAVRHRRGSPSARSRARPAGPARRGPCCPRSGRRRRGSP